MPEIAFSPDGKPTAWLLGELRRKGAQRGLGFGVVCVISGAATSPFRGFWRAAFPERRPLPLGRIATRDGRLTDEVKDILA